MSEDLRRLRDEFVDAMAQVFVFKTNAFPEGPSNPPYLTRRDAARALVAALDGATCPCSKGFGYLCATHQRPAETPAPSEPSPARVRGVEDVLAPLEWKLAIEHRDTLHLGLDIYRKEKRAHEEMAERVAAAVRVLTGKFPTESHRARTALAILEGRKP